ncbi:hypothetical protein BHM03_00050579, partial [Ensete ventricosum]
AGRKIKVTVKEKDVLYRRARPGPHHTSLRIGRPTKRSNEKRADLGLHPSDSSPLVRKEDGRWKNKKGGKVEEKKKTTTYGSRHPSPDLVSWRLDSAAGDDRGGAAATVRSKT